MTPGIMPLNMLELGRRGSKRLVVPIQVLQPPMGRWVSTANVTDIALEVLHVDWVEPDDGGE